MKPPDREESIKGRKILPSDFKPMICSLRVPNSKNLERAITKVDPESSWPPVNHDWFEILVCKKQILQGRDLGRNHTHPAELPPNGSVPNRSVTSDLLIFPVAILLTNPVDILYGLSGNLDGQHCEWFSNNVETRGINIRSAEAALAAAWRGVDEVYRAPLNGNHVGYKFDAPLRTVGDNAKQPQELTMLRDVALWMNWDHWNECDKHEKRKLSYERRAAILQGWGFDCTAMAVKKVKEKILG